MSDLRSRVDAWLDADLAPATPRDEALAVAAAVTRARRARARRRTVTAGAVTAVAAGVAAAVAVSGVPTLTTRPAPPAGPTPTGRASDVGPATVRYPDGTTVTWPAPGNGRPWTADGDSTVPVDDLARAHQLGVRKALYAEGVPLPDELDAAELDSGVTVRGYGGLPVAYEVRFALVDGSRRGGVEVWVTRGGAVRGPVWDRCGAWPEGTPGLGSWTPRDTVGCRVITDVPGAGTPVVVGQRPLGGGTERSAFSVRPDGTAVLVVVSTDPDTAPPLRELPAADALARIVTMTDWPRSAQQEGMGLSVVYPDGDGTTTTVPWPAPASGLPWFVEDPSVAPGSAAMEATAGARDLAAALADLVPDVVLVGGPAPSAAVLGAVDGVPTAYSAEVTSGSGQAGTAYRVYATRGGLTSRPVTFDLCGTWPPDVPGLAVDEEEKAVWLKVFGTPRRCSLHWTSHGAVIHLVAPPSVQTEFAPARSFLHAFTVRGDGTAFAAQTLALPGQDHAELLSRLDTLVFELAYPTRP